MYVDIGAQQERVFIPIAAETTGLLGRPLRAKLPLHKWPPSPHPNFSKQGKPTHKS